MKNLRLMFPALPAILMLIVVCASMQQAQATMEWKEGSNRYSKFHAEVKALWEKSDQYSSSADFLKALKDILDKYEPKATGNEEAKDKDNGKAVQKGAAKSDALKELDLELAFKLFPEGDDKMKSAFPRLEGNKWYILRGTLELNKFTGFELYGIRKGNRAITLSTANALDYCFPALRANLGKEVILGTNEVTYANMASNSDAKKLADKGYALRNLHVLNAGKTMLAGIPPAEKVEGGSDVQKHMDKLKDEYSQFMQVIGPANKAQKDQLVDPEKLPKGTLNLVVISPVTAAFSTQTQTLFIKIEGPVVKHFQQEKVATATPVKANFSGIPQGKYTITAEYGSRTATREVEVDDYTEIMDFIMY